MSSENITSGNRLQDLTGKKFKWWSVVCRASRVSSKGEAYWKCVCECGAEREVRGTALRQGKSTNCGCRTPELISKKLTIHGWRKHPLYKRWKQMIRRCHNPADSGYRIYGGRGIRVCYRWRTSLESFLSDLGNPPTPDHTIERIDNNRGYEPGNCRWCHKTEQAKNTRATRWVFLDGVRMCLADAALKLKMRPATLSQRLLRGWSMAEACEIPVISDSKETRRLRAAAKAARQAG